VSWLMDGDSQQLCYCFKRRRERLLLLPSLLFPFLFFVFQWFSFILLVCFFNFLPRFKLFLPFPMFRFLSFYSLCPLPLGLFFPLFGLFSPLFCSFSPLTLIVPLFYLSQSLPCLWFSPFFFFFGPFPFLFPSFSSLRSLFSLLVPPLLCWRWVSIYRAKGEGALYCCAWGVGQHRVGWWARLARRGAPDFSSSRCVGLRAFAGHAARRIK